MQNTTLVLQIVVTNEWLSYNSVVVNDKFHCIGEILFVSRSHIGEKYI